MNNRVNLVFFGSSLSRRRMLSFLQMVTYRSKYLDDPSRFILFVGALKFQD